MRSISVFKKQFYKFKETDYFFIWIYYFIITSFSIFISIDTKQFNNGYVPVTLYVWLISGWIVPCFYIVKTLMKSNLNKKEKVNRIVKLSILNVTLFPIMFYIIELAVNVFAEWIYYLY